MPLFDIISSFFSTPSAARVGIRLADAEVSGAVRINTQMEETSSSGGIQIMKRRKSRSRSSSHGPDGDPHHSPNRRSSRGRRGRSGRRSRSRKSKGKKGSKGSKGSKGKKTSRSGKVKAASASPAGKRMELCVQDEAAMGNPDPTVRAAALQRMKHLGATHLRMMVYMHQLHPCLGADAVQQNLATYDTAVKEAQAAGLTVQVVLTGVAAPWGAPTVNKAQCAQPTGVNPSPANYAKFVKSMVKHFSDLGVHRYSLWNEPNLAAFLCTGTPVEKTPGDIDSTRCAGGTIAKNADLYAKLYKAGHSVIRSLERKKSIPRTEIFMGELSPTKGSDRFVARLMSRGPWQADGFAVHPYQYCTPPDSQKKEYVPGIQCNWPAGGSYGIAYAKSWNNKLKSLHRQGRLSTPGRKAVPLYLTEFGYHRDGKAALPESVRATWYPRAMSQAKRSGAKGMNIYQIFGGDLSGDAWDTGIVASDNQPMPSFHALKAWSRKNGYPVRN